MRLDEIANSKVDFKIDLDSKNFYNLRATINGRIIAFSAMLENPATDEWWVEFTEEQPTYSSSKLTGSGKEFEVAGFIVSALRMFVERRKPKIIVFRTDKTEARNDDEATVREKVYLKLLKRHFPQFTITSKSFKDFGDFKLTLKEEQA